MVDELNLCDEQQMQFRKALRQFATGVTVITTFCEKRGPLGFTANSFNSVSLSPPLILWSLSNKSRNRSAFEMAQHYGVNILGVDQLELASRFASPSDDRFAGVCWRLSSFRVPLLDGCAAWFECKSRTQYEIGDHTLFIGEVMKFGRSDEQPLIYSEGSYGTSAPVLGKTRKAPFD